MTMEATPKAKRYHRRKLILAGAALFMQFGFFTALILTGLSQRMATWAAALSGQNVWIETGLYLAMLGVAAEIVFFPLSLRRGYGLEKEYGLSRQTFFGWLKDHAKSAALSAALMLVLTEILYAFIRFGGWWWWVWTGAVFCLVFIVLARVAPVLIFPLFFTFRPLDEGPLRERLENLARRAGAAVAGIFEMNLSRKSHTVNAALAGLGKTRRVILADNLLRRFTDDEIEIVVAHELGHHRNRDLLKGIALQTAMIFLFLWSVNVLAQPCALKLGFDGLNDIAAFPLLALVAAGLGTVTMPALNVLMRRFERNADRYAVEITGRPEALMSAMRRLGAMNLANPSPHPIIEALFHSHPSIERRIAFCQRAIDARGNPESESGASFGRRLWEILPAVFWVAAISYLSHQESSAFSLFRFVRIPHADKIVHAGLFFFLALILGRAWSPRRTMSWSAVLAIWAVSALYGAGDEFHQRFVEGRSCDAADWAVDSLAAAVGALFWRLNAPRPRCE